VELIGKKPSKELISYVRKRIMSNIINFIVVLMLSLLIMGFILAYTGTRSIYGFDAFLLIIIVYFVSTYLSMCLLVKITKGYTIGGLVFGLKIIKANNKDIKKIECLQRILLSTTQILYFYWFAYVKFNSNGQFYYDEKFDTKVIGRKHIFEEENIEYFEYNFLKDFFIYSIISFVVLAIVALVSDTMFGFK